MPRGNPAQHQNDYFASYIGSTVLVNVDGTVSSNPTPLPAGRYTLFCPETAVYLRQGGAGGTVSSSDFRLEKGVYRSLTVDDSANGFVFVTTADGAGGKLRITNSSSEL